MLCVKMKSENQREELCKGVPKAGIGRPLNTTPPNDAVIDFELGYTTYPVNVALMMKAVSAPLRISRVPYAPCKF